MAPSNCFILFPLQTGKLLLRVEQNALVLGTWSQATIVKKRNLGGKTAWLSKVTAMQGSPLKEGQTYPNPSLS